MVVRSINVSMFVSIVCVSVMKVVFSLVIVMCVNGSVWLKMVMLMKLSSRLWCLVWLRGVMGRVMDLFMGGLICECYGDVLVLVVFFFDFGDDYVVDFFGGVYMGVVVWLVVDVVNVDDVDG